jgi:uncharacterized repeat protein (TIGR02543 family)
MSAKRLAVVLALAMPLTASAAQKWLDGGMQTTSHLNCISGSIEMLSDELIGYWGDDQATWPAVGDVFYTRVMMANVGNVCSGYYAAHMELILPAGTALAIDAANPIRCYANRFSDPPGAANNCPTSLSVGSYGYNLDSTAGPWALPMGWMIQVWVPIYSTKKMSGIATNDYLQAYTKAIDGSGNPTDVVKQGLFVADNLPTVAYGTPSSTKVSDVAAHSEAYVWNHYVGGNAWFDLGTTTAYGYTDSPVPISSSANGYIVYDDWNPGLLAPSTTYHWRVRFVDATGLIYNGVDQTFTTASGPVGTQYGFTVSPPQNGTVALSPSGGSYSPGTVVDATATPAAGYDFTGWKLDGSGMGTTNPLSVTMNGDHHLEATFTPQPPPSDAGTPVPPMPDGGGTAPDGGGPIADGGGTVADGGGTVPDGGGTVADAGGSKPDGGGLAGDGGGTAGDGGGGSGDGGHSGGGGATPPGGCGCGGTAMGSLALGGIALLRRRRR